MRTAATIFSWIGGILTVVAIWVGFAPYLQQHMGLISVPIIKTILVLAILSFRESLIDKDHKFVAGFLTLLFVSLIGGILTFSIKTDYVWTPSSNGTPVEEPLPSTYTKSSAEEQIKTLRELLDKGIIDLDYYSKRLEEIKRNIGPNGNRDTLSTASMAPSNDPTPSTKAEAVNKVRSLYFKHLITREEFEERLEEINKQFPEE